MKYIFRSIDREKFWLGAIIVLALVLRTWNVDWDQGQHLNPDERFLTLVGIDARLPVSWEEYLNPDVSKLNPYIIGRDFFVYGRFVLILTKLLAVEWGMDNYYDYAILGRWMSAVFDVGTVLLTFLLGKKLTEITNNKLQILNKSKIQNNKVISEQQKEATKQRNNESSKYALWGAFFYAVAVVPIQQAHFATVDAPLVFFLTAAIYLSLKFYYERRYYWVLGSGVLWGLGLATKVSAVYVLPLIGIWGISTFMGELRKWRVGDYLGKSFLAGTIFVLGACLMLRVADPYLFEKASWLDWRVSADFLTDIEELRGWNNPEAWFPPGVQWINIDRRWYSLVNMAVFGVGLPYFGLSLAGFWFLWRLRRPEVWIVLAWAGGLFWYQASQYAQPMRYFYILYPWLALAAGLALRRLWYWHGKRTGMVVLALVLIWPMSFMSIYMEKHSRVQATEWMYENLETGSVLAEEHWDDPLPLLLPGEDSGRFEVLQMPVFGADDEMKWKEMNSILQRADYIVFSSNRGYGSISQVSERYPRMSKFYDDLFVGKFGYEKFKEFTVFPGFLGWEFDDQWADESFTVYDHPKVIIFKKISDER